ncbi:MAG TPA: hypothetical protein DEF45_24165 [Rhodopirellula sp.]|nr:hypothetical protein [Rhodopirellula sp.]
MRGFEGKIGLSFFPCGIAQNHVNHGFAKSQFGPNNILGIVLRKMGWPFIERGIYSNQHSALHYFGRAADKVIMACENI